MDSSIDDKDIRSRRQKLCRVRNPVERFWEDCLLIRGGLALSDFPGLSKSPVSKWRIVRAKTQTKAFFFEEILINIP